MPSILLKKTYYSKQTRTPQESIDTDPIDLRLAQNPIETNGLQCPDIIVRADPLMFLPAEYKRIEQDIYQISK